MRERLKKFLGGIFLASSALGLFGLPADLPTWYRCVRYRGSYCPDLSALWSPQVDLAVLFNTAFLILGILLLLPPARLSALFPTSWTPDVPSASRTRRIAPPIALPVPPSPLYPDRPMVSVTPEYLTGLFKDHTEIEGERLRPAPRKLRHGVGEDSA